MYTKMFPPVSTDILQDFDNVCGMSFFIWTAAMSTMMFTPTARDILQLAKCHETLIRKLFTRLTS